ncbi:MAG: tryptophan-rich sensory protein [Acidobacteria bacterium]|nr:tryptophan-rich sensory protein [Acidobacteriota bacterium]
MRNYLILVVLVTICLAVGFVGSLATRTSVDTWYAGLSKPAWTPPNWVFGPVWTLLYILMAVAAWLVVRQSVLRESRLAIFAFGVQLVLNLAWSFLFFWLRVPGIAFFEIWVLWTAILVTVVLFFRVSATAGWLMAPYLVWVSYAAALNFAIWRMNTGSS